MHDSADLDQGAQIARQLRSRRQLAQQPVRLQIDHIPGRDELRLRAGMAVVKFHTAGGNAAVDLIQQKQKHRIADGDLISMAQPLLLHRDSVHQSAIAAGQILDLKTPVFRAPQQAMLPRNRRIHYRHCIRWIAAQRGFTCGQHNCLVFERSCGGK